MTVLRRARRAFAPCSQCNRRFEQSPSPWEDGKAYENRLQVFALLAARADLRARP